MRGSSIFSIKIKLPLFSPKRVFYKVSMFFDVKFLIIYVQLINAFNEFI